MLSAPRVSATAAAAIIVRVVTARAARRLRRARAALDGLLFPTRLVLLVSKCPPRLEDELLVVDDSELELDGDGLRSFSVIAALSRRSPSKSIHLGVPGQ